MMGMDVVVGRLEAAPGNGDAGLRCNYWENGQQEPHSTRQPSNRVHRLQSKLQKASSSSLPQGCFFPSALVLNGSPAAGPAGADVNGPGVSFDARPDAANEHMTRQSFPRSKVCCYKANTIFPAL